MSEKPEALRLAENLENPWHGLMVSSRLLPGVDPLIVGGLRLDAAAELRRQHADNERLRGLLREIADETYDSWTNGARAQRIAESALKEVPR
jgi:hypothetical protein